MSHDVSALTTLLAAKHWKAADEETARLLIADADVGGYMGVDADEASQLDCSLLRAVDDAWSSASDGRFGFAAQRRILDETIAEGLSSNETWREFGRSVGWVNAREWIEADEVRYEDDAPPGHLPYSPSFGTAVNTGRVYEGFLGFYARVGECL